MSILITGANGKLGKGSINFLLSKGYDSKNIYALVRSEEKGLEFKEKGVNIRIGDYEDEASLVIAFKGIDKILFISSNDPTRRTEQHRNVIKAATSVGTVKHIVYTSLSKNISQVPSPIQFIRDSHNETEKLIKESGLTYTILLNGLYSDCLPEFFFGPNVIETGIFFPGGNGSASYATRSDMSEAAANVLSSDDIEKHKSKEYNLHGTTSNTIEDTSEILSTIVGKKVTYTSPDIEIFRSTLASFGVPSHYIEISVAFGLSIQNSELNIDSLESDLPNLLGREPTSFQLIAFFENKIRYQCKKISINFCIKAKDCDDTIVEEQEDIGGSTRGSN
ncbi:hypothetical protein ACTA71_010267 [Dictyostelium dimigraforme]